MLDFTNWLMVFLRVSAMFAIFPVFSASNFPVQLRLALGALLSLLICPVIPTTAVPQDLWGLVGAMAMEVGIGLTLGFVSRMVFYALDLVAAIISTEIGLQLPAGINPMSGGQTNSAGTLLYYLAAMIWLSLDMHHWMIVGIQRTYNFLPIGGAHVSSAVMTDVVARTSQTFLIGLQLAAPIMAVSFIINLVFSILGRAVPQMNVFQESFVFRIIIGLSVLA